LVAASPNWHFSTVVIYTSIPSVDHLIDLAGIKETVISFGQYRQIRGLGIELGAPEPLASVPWHPAQLSKN